MISWAFTYFFIGLVTFNNFIRGDEKVEVNHLDLIGLNTFIKERNPHFVETFNDKTTLKNNWIISEAKKEGVDADIAKYDGDWLIDSPLKHSMKEDYGLMFKQRAKHRAISSVLKQEFNFNVQPFILQYEVLFQDGQECGGGYVKMITGSRDKIILKNFHDKTPYTIMFGPDKCGSSSWIRFIFRHKNPLNGTMQEKHSKPVTTKIDEIFTDGKPHLFALFLYPDNSFKILLDNKVVNEGSLLNDFTPPVNPPAEIDDPTDSKPADWDDREHIPDPDAKKPDDWDENEPHMISDPSATKPDNWLDNEPLYIRDPSAEKPHDWDVEMDGEWEAPLVPNPACEDAGGCGEWTPPKIHNPSYKGKWSAPVIPNPNYKGKWTPRKIPNEDYFEDSEPFKMEKIGAIGFELWSMSPNILFDNIIVTDSEETAKQFAQMTFEIKMLNIEQSADTVVSQFIAFTNRYPWLWAIYTIVLLILVTLIVYCCFINFKDNYEHKKTDQPQPDINDESLTSNSEQTQSVHDDESKRESSDDKLTNPDSDSDEEHAETNIVQTSDPTGGSEMTDDQNSAGEVKDSSRYKSIPTGDSSLLSNSGELADNSHTTSEVESSDYTVGEEKIEEVAESTQTKEGNDQTDK